MSLRFIAHLSRMLLSYLLNRSTGICSFPTSKRRGEHEANGFTTFVQQQARMRSISRVSHTYHGCRSSGPASNIILSRHVIL